MNTFQLFLRISLSALLVLSTSVLPHHHHGRIACIVVERCAEDGHVNDSHTGHSDSDANGEDPCVVCTAHAVVSTCSRHGGTPDDFSSSLFLAADSWALPPLLSTANAPFATPPAAILLRQAHSPAALRAPPAFS